MHADLVRPAGVDLRLDERGMVQSLQHAVTGMRSAAIGVWVKRGAKVQHIADLDGAFQGKPVYLESLRRIREAHGGGEPLFRSYAVELAALLGAAAYRELARLCELRRPLGLVAVHPAERDAVG